MTDDILNKLANDVKAACLKACAKVPSILRIRNPQNDYQRGYNHACDDFEARIRQFDEHKR